MEDKIKENKIETEKKQEVKQEQAKSVEVKETKKQESKSNKVEEKKEETKERKVILQREYVVPLRREFLKVPRHVRGKKAVKALKEFIAKHMKIYDRDLRKVKVDIYLNNEIRFRGMRKPCAKIKVRAVKYDDGIVQVSLVNLPKHIEFEIARIAKRKAEKLVNEKAAGKVEAKEEKKEESKDTKEKTESSKEAMLKEEKAAAKEAKHLAGAKAAPKIKRKALKK